MFRNDDFIHKLQLNKFFGKTCQPVTSYLENIIRDAEFLLRKDGLIVNVEGWYHPEGKVIGEVLYVPDRRGDRIIFGQRYRKITLFTDTYEPIPYIERAKILREIDPRLDQVESNPYLARYKQIFPVNDFVAHFSSQRTMNFMLKNSTGLQDGLLKDIDNMLALLDIDRNEIKLGLTGASLLGNLRRYHDLDLVFISDLKQNKKIFKKMRNLSIEEKSKRVFEGGKGWTIRFFNDFGHLMCNFFGYKNPNDAPLRQFRMNVLQENICVEGTVSDDTHSMYTPTILQLQDIRLSSRIIKYPENFYGKQISLIIYHKASRGECVFGDRVKAWGALVEVDTLENIYPAVCVIDREGVRNLTPPWKNYYTSL